MNQITNYSSVVALLRDDVRGIECVYEYDDAERTKPHKTYTFKTLDPTIRKGDWVVVPKKDNIGFTIVHVFGVDGDIDVEDLNIEYAWIAGRFDPADYYDLLNKEQEMISSLKKAERTSRRKEIAEKVLAHVDASELNKVKQIGQVPENSVDPDEPDDPTVIKSGDDILDEQ